MISSAECRRVAAKLPDLRASMQNLALLSFVSRNRRNSNNNDDKHAQLLAARKAAAAAVRVRVRATAM